MKPVTWTDSTSKTQSDLQGITSSNNISRVSCRRNVTRVRGRAQAVSRRPPIAEARVRALVRSCWICGEQSGTEAGFLQILRFPMSILIPPTAPHASSIIWGWYNRSISGRRTKWTQSHPTPPHENKKKKRKTGLELHVRNVEFSGIISWVYIILMGNILLKFNDKKRSENEKCIWNMNSVFLVFVLERNSRILQGILEMFHSSHKFAQSAC
jgi:hypothetical protein